MDVSVRVKDDYLDEEEYWERQVQGRFRALHRRRKVTKLVGLCAEVLADHLNDIESLEGVGEELVLLIWLQFTRHYGTRDLSRESQGVVLRGLAAHLWPWAEDLLAFSFLNHDEGFGEEQLARLLEAAQPVINNTPLSLHRPRREMLTHDQAQQVFKRYKKSAIAYFFCGGGTKGKLREKKKKQKEAKPEDLFKKAKKRYYYRTDKWHIREERRDQLLALIGPERMDVYVHVLRCACFSAGRGLSLLL